MRNKRRKIWIDRFQTKLSIRLASYFLLYQFAVWSLFWMGARLNTLGDMIGPMSSTFGMILTPMVTVGLAFLFIYDALKETHRIVGPLYRFRKTIEAVTAGGEISLIKLRDGDHLLELKDELNAMLLELEQRGAITLTTPADSPLRQPTPV